MDIILYNIVVALTSLTFGYLLGSIPFGVIISKLKYHQDVRDFGSNNSGGTNVGRVYGKKMGILTIVLDMLKCMIALVSVYLVITYSPLNDAFISHFGVGMWDDGVLYYYLAGLGASLGHCFPLYAHFKGGKTVSVFCGFAIITSWLETLIGIFIYFGTKKFSKYVSLASIFTSIGGTIISWLMYILSFVLPINLANLGMWGWGHFFLAGWEHATITSLITILLIVRHIPNIKRIKSGNEFQAVSNPK